MQRITLDLNTNLYEMLKVIQDSSDTDIVLEMPKGFLLFENWLNLRIVQEKAKKWNKNLQFITQDPYGLNIIKTLNETNQNLSFYGKNLFEGQNQGSNPVKNAKAAIGLNLKKLFTLLSFVKLFKLKKSKKLAFLIFIVFALFVGGLFFYLQNFSRAQVVIFFDKEILTKSAQIRVGEGLKLDVNEKTLPGLKVSKNVEKTLEVPSTGYKLKGEKAQGSVTFYNSTQDEITLEKGAQITAKEKDKTFVFALKEKVVVPARTDSPPPDTTIIKGTAKGEVLAFDIGEAYNLKKDTEFSVKGYSKSDLVGLSNEDFKGGYSKQVVIVSSADVSKLEKELSLPVSLYSKDQIEGLVPVGYVLIPDSLEIKNKKITLNANVGDEKEKLSGSIIAQIDGLTYLKSDLEKLIVEMSKNLVPPGFEFFSFSQDMEIEVLGNTSRTVLNSSQADLQVTFRFFISPKISKDDIFNGIAGKSVEDAKSFIESINGVSQAQVTLHSKTPFFSKIPKKKNLVEIELKVKE